MARKATVAAAIAFLIWFMARQAGRSERMLTVDDARALVRDLNRTEFNGWFREDDVLAIMKIESNFDPMAQRFEAHIITEVTPHGDASLGIMQVLYSTAVDRGYTGKPLGLLDPRVGTRMGMRQLLWSHEFLSDRLGRAPTTREWIGSYNAGVGNALKGNIPERYVEKWVRERARLAGVG